MNHLDAKGTNVTHQERSRKTSGIVTRLFAALRDVLAVRARGARSSVPVVVSATVFVVGALALAAPVTVVAAEGPYFEGSQKAVGIHATRATIEFSFTYNYIPTQWRIEYATSEAGPWTLGASGTVEGREYEPQDVTIQRLNPDTAYYVHVSVSNHKGSQEREIKFTTTAVGPPEVQGKCSDTYYAVGEFSNPGERFLELCSRSHTTSIDLKARIQGNGASTKYQFEYAESESGPYKPVPGAGGTVTVAEDFAEPELTLTGLAPETYYYPRVTVTSEKGTHVTRKGLVRTKSIKPQANIQRGSITKITGTSAHLAGGVDPGTYETSWRFEYATSQAGPYTPVPGANGTITAAEAGEEAVKVQGDLSGLTPAITYYVRLFAENVNATSISDPPRGFETAGPPFVMTFAVHALHGEAMRALGSVRPDGLDTHYRVQYVSQEKYAAGEWAEAQETGELDAGSGEFSPAEDDYPTAIVGADLPGLVPGETYDYRLVASNQVGVAHGSTQSVTAPSPAPAGEPSACPNEALRSGPSASLPDCRAYEQITPVDKEGALEIANYGFTLAAPGAFVGEDGNHIMFVDELVNWGSVPLDGQSPYYFTRTETGWQMTATASQPETGVHRPAPQLFSPDLDEFAFESFYNTAGEKGASPSREFDVGPPGGPYTLLASVPTAQRGGEPGGLVAGSEDFSKLILQVEDRNLAGSPTGTSSGEDLYEYSEGELRQLNVLTGGVPVGSCGATIVRGAEEHGIAGSRHAVSADGSHVFFEAVPGNTCSSPSHLYVRIDGVETLDLGAGSFLAANTQGSEVLLDRRIGEAREIVLEGTASSATTPLFTAPHGIGGEPVVSDNLTAIYFYSPDRLGPEAPPVSPATGFNAYNLYRYDILTKTLRFVAQVGDPTSQYVTPDGRYDYFEAPSSSTGSAHAMGQSVAGLPGGANDTTQTFRYDAAEDLVECVSCASPFDPEPAQPSVFKSRRALGRAATQDGLPNVTVASGNGDYAFFSTAAALLPSDVDGEVTPEIGKGHEHSSQENDTSVSSDVYEWRRNGIDGCEHVQGCLALITNGRGGFLNLFVGSADEGRDVFVITGSQFVPTDTDSALDIYDARIGGGFPPPRPRPVECDGDACSTPFVAPSDPTPSSSTFQGAGNVLVTALPEAKSKPKPRKKSKKNSKVKRKGRKAGAKHSRRTARIRNAGANGRAGK